MPLVVAPAQTTPPDPPDPVVVNDVYLVRVQVGDATPPTDAQITASLTRLGSVNAVVYEILRNRLANLLAGPAKVSSTGYSEDNTANIEALKAQIAAVGAGVDPEAVVTANSITTTTLYRSDRRGR